MALRKSSTEAKADAIRSAMLRGSATLPEAAAVLSRSYETIRIHVRLRKIKTFRIGGRSYVTLQELKRLGVAFPHSIQGAKMETTKEVDSLFDTNLDNGDIHDI